MKLHHVGVAVSNLDEGIRHYESLGFPLAHRETVASQKVRVAFMGSGPWIELLEGDGPDSAVCRFIAKRGAGQHHLAFSVPDIAKELERQAAAGAVLIDAVARPGAWGHQVAFLHPKSHGGVLVELVQESQ